MICTRLSLVLVLCALIISPATAEPQIIAGVGIDHPVTFERLRPDVEQGRQRSASNLWGAPVSSAEVHKASIPMGMRLTGASGAIEIAKFKFGTGRPLDLDVLARRTTAALEKPGLKILNQFASATRVAGHEGRRLSLEAEGNGWFLYGEELLIYDAGNSNLWYIPVVLSRRFFAKLMVESDRSYPKSVLETVRVIETPKTSP